MSEAPKEVWCEPYLGYDYVEDWGDGSWSSRTNDGMKYVRADRIEELEAKLAKALTALGDVQLFVKDLAPYADQGHTLVPALERACATYMELKGETNV